MLMDSSFFSYKASNSAARLAAFSAKCQVMQYSMVIFTGILSSLCC